MSASGSDGVTLTSGALATGGGRTGLGCGAGMGCATGAGGMGAGVGLGAGGGGAGFGGGAGMGAQQALVAAVVWVLVEARVRAAALQALWARSAGARQTTTRLQMTRFHQCVSSSRPRSEPQSAGHGPAAPARTRAASLCRAAGQIQGGLQCWAWRSGGLSMGARLTCRFERTGRHVTRRLFAACP